MARYIFVTGGVVSSLGKGLSSASLAYLLNSQGYKVRVRKMDPYLNVDPGTMSPFQHGEVFVTDDGAETDLDLGHYERFTNISAKQSDNITTGSFKNKSYYGYSSSVLKSGICKYFRRKQFDKFEWCVIEMMIFGLKDKGLLTNVLNRMKILLMEELVCINLGDIHNCICIFKQIDEEEELFNKIKNILQICSIVKQFNRGRIVSYINNWHKLKPIKFESII